MPLTIPSLELEEIPLRLDTRGVLQFCAIRQEAVLANFEIGISASAHDDWEVTSVTMGTQELRGDLFRRVAQHIEDAFGSRIADHVAEHLGDARDQVAYDERAFAMGW